jgi:hypothetical protein
MSQTFKFRNQDVVLDAAGALEMVADYDKLRQDLSELFSIGITNNGFGAGLIDLVGASDSFDDGYASNVEFTLRDRIESAISRFQVLQKRNLNNMPPAEQVVGLSDLNVQQDPTNPTTYRWKVVLRTLAGEVTRSGKLSIPG